MKTISTISLAALFALVVPACASDPATTNDDDLDDDDDVPTQPDPKMDATGTYRVNSTFDLAANMPGNSFLQGLIAATDGADDPMRWVLDEIVEDMDDGTLKDFLQAAVPFVAPELNEEVTQLAPELVNRLKAVGQRTAELYKKFGVNETLVVSLGAGADVSLIGKFTMDSVRFEVNGVPHDYLLADYDIDNVVTENVSLTFTNDNMLAVGTRALPIQYGKLIRIGFDNAVIPAIDPNSHSLAQLLSNSVDCAAVGAALNAEIGIGGTAFWTSACNAGMTAAADKIYDAMIAEDLMINLNMSGSSRATDSNADWKIDRLQFGTWNGIMNYDGADTNIAQPATYNGERMVQTL